MNPLFLLATSAASHSHSFVDALPHLAGMGMVLVSLAILWGVCALTAKLVATFQPETKAATAAPVKAVAPAPVVTDPSAIAPEIIAVIAAAVATVSGNKPVHIVSIQPMSTSWERAGRQSVLTSHRIR